MNHNVLKSGDQIALSGVSSICQSKSEPELAVTYFMQQAGLIARFQQDTYIALPPRKRADIFMQYLCDDRMSAIWSMRGGEGAADVLPFLLAQLSRIRRAKPKLLIGFSDFTPMLVYFQQHLAWPCLHAPGARQLSSGALSATSETATLDWVLAKKSQLHLPYLTPLNNAACYGKSLRAELIGGNLSLVNISIGDLWELDVRGKIVLLEEVNEPPYKVSRSLKYLQRVGFFNGAKALLLAGSDPVMRTPSMLGVLTDFARTCCFPVLLTHLVGHGEDNYPLPFYLTAKLSLGSQAVLSMTAQPSG